MSYETFIFKQASSLFTPHQRQALQIGRMFERTKGKSPNSQAVLNSQANHGPMSMNDIAAQKQQKEFDKQQKDFSKQQQNFQKEQEQFGAQQKEVETMREELEHKQRVLERRRELEELETKRKPGGPDPVVKTINNHATQTAKRIRQNLSRLLSR
jgi:hypothetical protein